MNSFAELEKIRTNFNFVNAKIRETLAGASRQENSVKLVVVTKGQSVEKMQALIDSGGAILGENYPEETASKIPELIGTEKVQWHMIGHIQSRKIKYLVRYFDVIESVDSLQTAARLDQRYSEAERKIKILLEVSLGGEESKQGYVLKDRDRWPGFVQEILTIRSFAHLDLVGLMTMPPLGVNPEDSRQYFKLCKELGSFVNDQIGSRVITEYSMGTSHDYLVAVEEGATIVRVGEAIMGARNYT